VRSLVTDLEHHQATPRPRAPRHQLSVGWQAASHKHVVHSRVQQPQQQAMAKSCGAQDVAHAGEKQESPKKTVNKDWSAMLEGRLQHPNAAIPMWIFVLRPEALLVPRDQQQIAWLATLCPSRPDPGMFARVLAREGVPAGSLVAHHVTGMGAQRATATPLALPG